MARRDHRYVVVELQGRLGNQLFQFAAGHALARRRDARLRFWPERVPPGDLLLPRLLGDRYREASAGEMLRTGRLVSGVPAQAAWRGAVFHTARWARRLSGRTPPSIVVWNDTGRFRPTFFDTDLPVRLVGHLQSERYFADCGDEIVAALRWPPNAPDLEAGSQPAVAVSFRRGDYNTLGYALPMSYYEQALDLVFSRVPDATILLFGDDADFVDLAADRLTCYGPVDNTLARAVDPISQLHLMSQCDHCVIANSTFAWWGAWLGDRRAPTRDRLVVAPFEFGAGGERLPDRWITLKTGITAF